MTKIRNKAVNEGRPRHSVQAKKRAGTYDATRDKMRVEDGLAGIETKRYRMPLGWSVSQLRLAGEIVEYLHANKLENGTYWERIIEYVDLNELGIELRAALGKQQAALVELDPKEKKNHKQIDVLVKIITNLHHAINKNHTTMQQFAMGFGIGAPINRERMANARHTATPTQEASEVLNKQFGFGKGASTTTT